MTRNAIHTEGAPKAVGPYSQGIRTGGLLFVSGQLPKPADGALIEDPAAATKQALENVRAIVEAGGLTMDDVVKVTIFLCDMGNFSQVNEAYAGYFSDPAPARACIEVAALPMGACLEIEAIAQASGGA